ncbi:phosphoglycerol geranylgeranyltransferase [Saccharicrinis aurantiacus]|uniref:geranylgeranylglyceryl/heptaprenylglyceryl phosphate synthase n=1 Tax=Saccharicrinis aurantiacus TaxID=1849719 RepID=UPI001FE5EA71|nr:geranylgeranylglyceryl/heptaprenylglyceryl phosphate synthase [Saccharicrinis aurantiacus]
MRTLASFTHTHINTKRMILELIKDKQKAGKKLLAMLIDPEKYPQNNLIKVITAIESAMPDLILVGGSLVSVKTDKVIKSLKQHLDIPVVLFPGSLLQVTPEADALLFISLISGRNSDLLIGNHVVVAPFLKESNLEVLSTGYILVESGKRTSVEYMSQTAPIPADKSDIAAATAIAGEMLGHKLIYLEGGSGAEVPIPQELIQKVKLSIDIPLIVGGGLNTAEKVKNACDAGADVIVVGNAFEKDISLLSEFRKIIKSY